MKIAFKINLLFTGIVTCILLGMAILVYNLSKENVRRDFSQRIKNRAARTAYLYDRFSSDTTNLLKSIDANSPPVLINRNVGIYDTGYRELYEFHDTSAGELRPDTIWLDKARENGEYFLNRDNIEIGVFYHTNQLFVLVAAENIEGRAYINNLRRIFNIYFPVAVLVSLLAGYLFSRTIIRPIKQTIRDVKLITSQNLSHRLFTGTGKDELAQLNGTFNELLNRLEESFAMEKRFISNASHELSTPLTAVSSQIEVSLLQERSPEEYREVLLSILKDAQGLHQLTRTLLEIAKAGSNGAISLEKVRIDEVLIKAHSVVLHQNPDYKVELAFAELPEDENECMVFGNVHLLQSAFKNIIENGCKYSPDNRVKSDLLFNGSVTEILFTNKSDFLPTDEIEKLFEPFYRSSNAENKPGVGLGLTLTRRIISLHKGTLTLRFDPEKGTVIHIVLPTLKK
ncbi:MAG: HAMP domain-containing sensor histidine kinase [Bacteroidota bacterium]|nr:HAMP domain-containing sensor histidine kinase [Bacteroidota bacterium]